jgi:hypothetical protein
MTGPDTTQAELAGMAAAIERAEGDLALAEEPARFLAALEEGAPPAAGESSPAGPQPSGAAGGARP